jgi:hypothetical protein
MQFQYTFEIYEDFMRVVLFSLEQFKFTTWYILIDSDTLC